MATTYINPFVFAGEELGGMVLLTPTSIAYTGTSASIGANGSVEFSAVSSLSLNGVFDATYDNYMIVCRNLGSTIDNITARLRVAGTDASGSNYTSQYLLANGSTVGANRLTGNHFLIGGGMSTSNRSGFVLNIYGPYLAQPTAKRDVNVSGESGAYLVDRADTHSLSTSYDGLSFIPASGNFTGLVSVYGLVGA